MGSDDEFKIVFNPLKKYLFHNEIKYHKIIKMSSSNFKLLWFSNCTLDENKKLSNITKLFKRNWYSFLDHISYLIRIKTIYTGYAGPNCIVNCDSSFVISHALYFNKNMKKTWNMKRSKKILMMSLDQHACILTPATA